MKRGRWGPRNPGATLPRYGGDMYRPQASRRDRLGAIFLVLTLHVGLLLALLNANGTIELDEVQPDLRIFDVTEPPPPPPPPVVVQEKPKETPKPKEREGAASAENIRSNASPVVAPKPVVVVPTPPPVTASPTPADGADKSQGASDRVGPGTGAGGQGTGTGSGGAGDGSGGGGRGGGSGPRLASRPLTERDYPGAMRRNWPPGARVMVAVRVQLDGRATDCKVNRSSGDPLIDGETCRLVQSKLRFRPAIDGDGRPYVAWYGYMQYPVNF